MNSDILLIGSFFLAGIILAWFIAKNKYEKKQGQESDTEHHGDTNTNVSPYGEDVNVLTKKYSVLEDKYQELEQKYNEQLQHDKTSAANEEIQKLNGEIVLLKEKNAQILADTEVHVKSLEKQLSESLNGHVDNAVASQLEEAQKLKKKISDLEEEIEDYEDDIANLQKKLRSKTSENTELQVAAEKSAHKLKELNGQYELVEHELESQKKENKEITEALAFVTEVLTASSVSDGKSKALFENVDALVNYIKEDLRDCTKDELDKSFFGADLESWAINKKKSWLQGKTTIALVGEFSAGKTSIVNRILSLDNPNIPLLPVSTKATTAIPTYITGGVGTLFMFVAPNNEQKSISEKTFKRVNKEVLDRIDGMSSLIKYFVMTYQNPNLNNLSILDTPGFNSNDKEDAERTIEVINECDALFWVVDVNSGTVNRSSLKLIKNHLKKPLYVVINKVDTKAKSEVDSVERLIKKTFKEEGVEVKGFIHFSAKANIDCIMNVIKGVERNNTKDSYLDNLNEALKVLKKNKHKEVKEAEKTCKALMNSCESITDKFYEAIQELHNDCELASEIPHYEEHLFRKDNYEMSQEEYENLCDVLQLICDNDCQSLANIYEEYGDEVANLNDAWNRYSEVDIAFKDFENCYEAFGKKCKRIK